MQKPTLFLLKTAIFVIAAFAFFAFAFPAHAAVRTWDGGGSTNNWSEDANWSDDTEPGGGDIATFDGTSTKDATVDTVISVGGIDINTGYSGTITQAAAITIGTQHFSQDAGTFTGASQDMTINGHFTLGGGTFTPTSGTWIVTNDVTFTGGTLSGSGKTLRQGTCSPSNITYAGNFNTATGLAVVIASHCVNTYTVKSGTTLTASFAGLDAWLVIESGATFTSAGNFDVYNLTNNGSLTTGAGTFLVDAFSVFGGTLNDLSATTGSFQVGRLTVNSGATLTLNPAITTIRVTENYDNDGTFSLVGRTLNMGACNPSTIDYAGNFNADTGVASVVISSNCTGQFTVPSGQTLTASFAGFDAWLVVSSGATFTSTGNVDVYNITNNGSFTAGAGTFLVDAFSVFGGTLNNLNASTSLDVGRLTVNSGATLSLNPVVTTVTVRENYDNQGTFSLTGRTLNIGTCGVASTINHAGNFNTDTGVSSVVIYTNCTSGFTVPSGLTLTASFALGGRTPTLLVNAGGTFTGIGETNIWSISNSGSFTAGTGAFTTVGDQANFNGTVNDLSAVTSGDINNSFIVGSGKTVSMAPVNYAFNYNFSNAGTITSSGTPTFTFDGNVASSSISSSSTLPVNVVINRTGGTTTVDSNLAITGNFTRTDGVVGNPSSAYTFTLPGNVFITTPDSLGGANLTLLLTGTSNQTFGSVPTLATPIRVNKASGTATLVTDLMMATSPLTIEEGSFGPGGFRIDSGAGISVEAGGTLVLIGSEPTMTAPTFASGSTAKYVGDGDGSPDVFGLQDFSYDDLVIQSIDSTDTFGPEGYNTLLNGLVEYYPFDEGSGTTTADGSGNGYTGTLFNMDGSNWSGDVPTSSYTNNYSLEFNGTDEYVDLGNPSLLPSGSSSRTICAWTKSDSVVSGFRVFFSYGTAGFGQFWTMAWNNSNMFFNGWFLDSETSSVFTSATWYNVCNSFDGTDLVTYVNGTEVKRLTLALSTLKNGLTYIGKRSDGFNWDGKIDEVRVYNRVLSSTEFSALAAGANSSTASVITDLDIAGDLTLNGGTLKLPTGTTTVSGDLIKLAGTINANGGTVDLGDANQAISGTWTFFNLTKVVASAATLTLPAGVTQTIAGTLTLQGAVGQLLSLVSSTPSSQARINPTGGRALDYLDVEDNLNQNALAMNCGSNCVDSGNNTNWIFGGGFTIGTISGHTTEAGGTATFTVVLDGPPTDDVVIPVSSSDLTEGTVSPSSLTFTDANWSTPQTVTVTGVNDFIDDGDIVYSIILAPAVSDDPGYDGLDPSDVSVTNDDNDSSSINVSTISNDTTEAGATATFTVSLTAAPSSDVSIGVSSSDTTEGTIVVSTLTFTPDNWMTPQTVTVTGVNDFLDDGDILYSIVLSTASSADSSYNGINPNDVSVTNIDNDTAGVTVGTISRHTTEGGQTATFTLVLNTQPSANVSIPYSTSDATEGTVTGSPAIFSNLNWSTPQTITVTGVDDVLLDGNISYSILIGSTTSSDPQYSGLDPSDVSVVNDDNDSPTFNVSAISGHTTEAGGTATFTVSLSSQPASDVTIPVSSSDLTEGTVAPSSLTFTDLNYATPQTVTVTGVDDLADDGDISYSIVLGAATSADSNYNGVNPSDVSVVNDDNDTIGVTVSAISRNTNEAGQTATFTIVLTSQPASDVTIGISSSDTTEGTVAPSSVTFTNVNWATPQTVTVTGVNDFIDDGDIAYTIITAAATSADGNYSGFNPGDVSVTNLDDDTAGFFVAGPSGNTTEAGGTATMSVVLTSLPSADVTISLTSNDLTEGTVSPSSFTFTTGNWNVAQVATVTGVDDVINDGDIVYSVITGVASSADGQYNGLNPGDVGFTNIDNENAGFTVSAISGNTTEAGVTASFTIALTSQPAADVVIPVSSGDTTEGTVVTSSLTFTNANWSTPQTVVVTGVNDDIDDGDVAYTIVLGVATSADSDYNGLNPSDVSVTNTDNDISAFTVSGISANTTEAGGVGTYTVRLATQPSGDVTISVASADNTEGTSSPSSLTFTTLNWATPQTVTVTGVDDLIDDGNIVYSIVNGAGVSSDPLYNGLDPADVTLSNIDDDTAGVTITQSLGDTVVTEDGATDTYTIVLNTQPTNSVTITIAPDSEVDTDVHILTFTTSSWSTPETITVSAIDDGDVEGTHAGIITHSASSSDPRYNAIGISSVTAVVMDNDSAGSSGGSGYVPPIRQTMTVLAPRGNEILTAGNDYLITWESTGNGQEYVNIYYSVSGTQYEIARNVLNTGSYNWHVPNETLQAVAVRVVGTDLVDEVASDISDSFSVIKEEEPPITVGDGATGVSPVTGEEEELSLVQAGTLIKGKSFSAVYYVDMDMKRRPFPNEQTFFTYYDSFVNVKEVSDATLATLTMGRPVPPKPGTVLVKIQSVNNVYSLGSDGLLHVIATEEMARQIYGMNWSDYVIDIEPTFFTYFKMGMPMSGLEKPSPDMKKRSELHAK